MDRRGLPASYGGTLFRSHLEARWAIFFDALDIKWEYEPQGFKVGDDITYLPDFVAFTALGTLWIEVKPSWDADLTGVERWRAFAHSRPQPSRAALLIGAPSTEAEHVMVAGDDTADDPMRAGWEDGDQAWRPCVAGYHFDLAYGHESRYGTLDDGCPQYHGADGRDRIEKAVKAALSHRFGKAA